MIARENVIRHYFNAWLEQDASFLDAIFEPAVIDSESWGPEYQGYDKVLYWFKEWNSRAKVLQWDIKQFIHQGNVTAVEWRFRNRYNDGKQEYFDGVSLFEFTNAEKVISVKEFGSTLPHYDPYTDEKPSSANAGIWLVKD